MSVKHLRPPWQPGQSGNPLGVNPGVFTMAAEIRRQTGQGQTLVEFYAAMFEGRPIPVPGGRAQRPTLEHRHMAAHGWRIAAGASAKEIIELTGDAPTTAEQRLALLRRLSDDERATLRGLLAKALATPDAPGPSASSAAGDLEPRIIRRRPDAARDRRACDARPAAQRRPRDRPGAGAPGSGGRVSCRAPRASAGFPANPPGLTVRESVVHPRRRTRPARHSPAVDVGPLGPGARRRGPSSSPTGRGPGGRAGGGTRACARERAPGAPPGLWDPPAPLPKFSAVGEVDFRRAPPDILARLLWTIPRSRRQGPQAGTPHVCHPVPTGPPAGWVETPGWRVAVRSVA